MKKNKLNKPKFYLIYMCVGRLMDSKMNRDQTSECKNKQSKNREQKGNHRMIW